MAINQYYVARRANKNDKRQVLAPSPFFRSSYVFVYTLTETPKCRYLWYWGQLLSIKGRQPTENKAEFSSKTWYKLLFLYNMVKGTLKISIANRKTFQLNWLREKGNSSNLGAVPLIHPCQAEGLSQPCWTHKTTKLIPSSNTILTRERKIIREPKIPRTKASTNWKHSECKTYVFLCDFFATETPKFDAHCPIGNSAT